MNKQPKVLVVDSDISFVKLAKIALEDSSYQVLTASNRREGLETARRDTPDMVIIGALEPHGDAFKLHREFRGNHRTHDMPMLVVDVRPEEHWQKGWRRSEGMDMDVEGYVSRPIEPGELVELVGGILERTAKAKSANSGMALDRMEELLKRVGQLEASLVR